MPPKALTMVPDQNAFETKPEIEPEQNPLNSELTQDELGKVLVDENPGFGAETQCVESIGPNHDDIYDVREKDQTSIQQEQILTANVSSFLNDDDLMIPTRPFTRPPTPIVSSGNVPAPKIISQNDNGPNMLIVGQHQAPPYRLFFPKNHYHTISAHYPSTANIRQVQHLYDTCFPLNYSPSFYSSLASPKSGQYQSQTFVLTSTDDPHVIDPSLTAIEDDSDAVISGTKIKFKSLNVLTAPAPNFNKDHCFDTNFSDVDQNSSSSKPCNLEQRRVTNLQVQLHPSILEPLQFNPLTTPLTMTPSRQDTHLENPIPDVIKTRARHYSSDFKQLTIPEYISSEHAEVSLASLDDIDSNPPPQSAYLHTATSSQFLHAENNHCPGTPAIHHQVIGSWVVRPATQTLTSLLPDLLHQTQSSSIVKGLMSISSWLTGSNSNPTSTQPQKQSTQPQLQPQPQTESVSYHPNLMRSVYICTLAIAPQFSGSGLGSLLLFNCLEFILKHYGCSYVYIHVLESNKKAVDMYRRFGFAIQETKPGYFYTLPISLFGAEPTVPLDQYLDKVLPKSALGDDADGNATAPVALDLSSQTLGLPLINAPTPNSTDPNDLTEQVILRSYRLPEEETGDALYMCLSMDLWKTSQRAKCLKWLQSILDL